MIELEQQKRAKRHAAYLRRKETGRQKEYEAKIKAEKKKKIEASKEEIRQEDRDNGVYHVFADHPEGQPTVVRKGEAFAGHESLLSTGTV